MTNRAFQARLRECVEPFGLRLLWQRDGLRQRELSRRIRLMAPTAVAALNDMELRGLITRVENTTDRRKINVFLTEHGMDISRPNASPCP